MRTPLTTAFLAEVRAEMSRQGVTQDRLAAATDMSAAALSRRLGGHAPLTVAEAEGLCDALGVDLLTIATRADEANRRRVAS